MSSNSTTQAFPKRPSKLRHTASQRFKSTYAYLMIAFAGLMANGTEFYVSPNGGDSGNGTGSQPWRTIQKGLNLVKPGDVLYVTAGVYDETNRTMSDGTASAPITIQGLPGSLLRCTNGTAGGATVGLVISNSWYIVRGLRFLSNQVQIKGLAASHNLVESNWVERSKAISVVSTDLPFTNGPCFNRIQFNVFTNMAYNIAAMGVGGYNNIIQSNVWWGGNDNDAVNFFGISNTFRGNLMVGMSPSAEHSGNHIDCFQTFGDAGQEAHWCVIENNVISNCLGHFFIANSLGAWNTTNNLAVSDIMVRNNIIIQSDGDSFLHAPRIQFVNNTFYGCGGVSGVPQIWVRYIPIYGYPTNCAVINNIIAESTANAPLAVDAELKAQTVCGFNFVSCVGGAAQPGLFGVSNLNGGNPLFFNTDLGTINLHLRGLSPCRGRGSNTIILAPYDIAGLLRTPPVDLGAYSVLAPPLNLRIRSPDR